MLSVEFQRPEGQLIFSKWLISRASKLSASQSVWPQTGGFTPLCLDPVLITHVADAVLVVAVYRRELDLLNRLDLQPFLEGFFHFHGQPGLWDRYASDACLRLLCHWVQDCGQQQEMFTGGEVAAVVDRVKISLAHPWDPLEHGSHGYPSDVGTWRKRLSVLEQVRYKNGSIDLRLTGDVALVH